MDTAAFFSAVAAVVIGALATFCGQAILEQRRRRHDFNMERMAVLQERRAGAYVDLLAAIDERMSWIRSALIATPSPEASARWFGETEGEHQFRLKARIAGFGSQEVQRRMTRWTKAYEQFWSVAIRAAERVVDPDEARAELDVRDALNESNSLTVEIRNVIWKELNPTSLPVAHGGTSGGR